MSARAIAESLYAHGVIDNPLQFRYLVWRTQSERRLQPGRYRFPLNSGERAVLAALTREGPAFLMVTIPEGFTMSQIAAVLDENGICKARDFLAVCQDTALLHKLGINFPSAEGFLFPESYEFMTGTRPADVVARLVAQFWSVYEQLDSAAQRPGPEVAQAVILASLVEKEAKLPGERPIIAGVFRNRLRRHLPLQSCATVEYILPEHKEVLSYQDLKTPSPYNTYLHSGLPPGPICNPGRAALAAALNPARTGYFFFVARGDGSHIFSVTPAEHEAALRRVRSLN